MQIASAPQLPIGLFFPRLSAPAPRRHRTDHHNVRGKSDQVVKSGCPQTVRPSHLASEFIEKNISQNVGPEEFMATER